MPGAIIVFSGMDGAGKSTQIERLCENLSGRGRPPIVFWSRGGYTPGINRLKSLLRRGSGGTAIPASGPSEKRTQAFSRPMVRKLWLTLAILDLGLLYGVWLRWKRLTGHIVICDRYLDDTKMDFELNFPEEAVADWLLWKLLAKFAPAPNVAFLLTIPVAESRRRSIEKQEPFPDSEETLEKRLANYHSWSDQAGWISLDGLQSRDTLADEILQAVDQAVRFELRETAAPHDSRAVDQS